MTRLIFREEDDNLLTYREDEGEKIEPEYYVPIIPMILINGETSIASGWSCNVPMFNPIDILMLIRKWINSEQSEQSEIIPWYRDFNGLIKKDGNRYAVYGNLQHIRGRTYKISELSVDYTFDKYKEKIIDPLWEVGSIEDVMYGGDAQILR